MSALLVTILCALTPLSYGQGWKDPKPTPSVIIAIPPLPGASPSKNRILLLSSSNRIVRWSGDSRGTVAVDQPGTSVVQPTGNPVQLKDSFVGRPSADWASGLNPAQGHPSVSRGKIPVYWPQSSVIQNGKHPPSAIDLPNERTVVLGQSGSSGSPPSHREEGNARKGSRGNSHQQQSTQQEGSQNVLQQENPSQQGQKNVVQQEGSQTRNQQRSVQRRNQPNNQSSTRVDSGSIFFNPDSPTNGPLPANNPSGSTDRPLPRNTGSVNRQPVPTVVDPPTLVRNRPQFVPAARDFVPPQTGSNVNQQTHQSSKNNIQTPPPRQVSPTDSQSVKPPPAPIDTPVIRSRPNTVVSSGKIEYTGNGNGGSAPSVPVDRQSKTGSQQANQNKPAPSPNPAPQPSNQKNPPPPLVINQSGSRAGPSAPRSTNGNGGTSTSQSAGPTQGGWNWNQAANQVNRPANPQVPRTIQGQVNPNLWQSRPTEQRNPTSTNKADSSGTGNPQQPVVPFPHNFPNRAPNNNARNSASGRQLPVVNPAQPVFPGMNPEVNLNQAQRNTNGYPQNNGGINPPGSSSPVGNLPTSFPAGMDIQLILNRIASQYEQARRNQLRGTNANPASLTGGSDGAGAQNPNSMPGNNLLGQRNNARSLNSNSPTGGLPINHIGNNPGSQSRGNLPLPGGQQFPELLPRQPSVLHGNQNAPAQGIPQWPTRPFPGNRQTDSPSNPTVWTSRPDGLPAPAAGGGLPPNRGNVPLFGQSWPVDASGNRGGATQSFPNQPGREMFLPTLPGLPSPTTTTPEPTEAPEIELEPTPRPTPFPNIWASLGLQPNSQGASRPGQAQPGGFPNAPFWNNRQQTPLPGAERPQAFFPQQPEGGQLTPIPNFRHGFQPLGRQTPRRNNMAQNQPFPLTPPVDSPRFRNRNGNGATNQAGPLTNSDANLPSQNQINRQPQSPSSVNSSNQPLYNNNGGGAPSRVQPAWRPPTQTGAGRRPPPNQTSDGPTPTNQNVAGQRPPNHSGAAQRPGVQTQVPNSPDQQNAEPKPPVRSTPQNPDIQGAWVPPARRRNPQETPRPRVNGQQINRENTPTPNRGLQQGPANSSTGVNPQGQNRNPINGMIPGMNPSLLALLNQRRNSQSGGVNPAFPGMPSGMTNGMQSQMMGMALVRQYQDRPCGPSKVLHQEYQRQYMRFMVAQQQQRQAQMAMLQAQAAARGGTAPGAAQSPNPMQQNPFMAAGNMPQQNPFMSPGGNMAALSGMIPLTAPESPEINYQCTVSESCGMTRQERQRTSTAQASRDCLSHSTGLVCCLG